MKRRAFVVAAALGFVVPTAGSAREVHGSTDSYAEPGVAVAWAILRGAGDAAIVVIRVVVEPKAFSSIAVAGIDPFTKREAEVVPVTAVADAIEIRVPRDRFAERAVFGEQVAVDERGGWFDTSWFTNVC